MDKVKLSLADPAQSMVYYPPFHNRKADGGIVSYVLTLVLGHTKAKSYTPTNFEVENDATTFHSIHVLSYPYFFNQWLFSEEL